MLLRHALTVTQAHLHDRFALICPYFFLPLIELMKSFHNGDWKWLCTHIATLSVPNHANSIVCCALEKKINNIIAFYELMLHCKLVSLNHFQVLHNISNWDIRNIRHELT